MANQNPFAKGHTAVGTGVAGAVQNPVQNPGIAGAVQNPGIVGGTIPNNANPVNTGGMVATPPVTFDSNRGSVEEVTFDSDIQISALDRFPKMKKDEVSRIAFTLFDSNGSPMIKMSSYFYDEGARKFFIAPKNEEVLKKCVAKLGEAKIRFATIVVRYETDNNGNMIDYGNGAWSYKLFAYTFSTDKFPTLKSLHKEWGLQNVDLLLTCSDIEFQKVTINPARQCIYRANEQVLAEVQLKAKELYEKNLNRHLGNSMSDEEILVTLGLAAPAPVGGAGTMVGGNPFGPGGQMGQAGAGFNNLVQH